MTFPGGTVTIPGVLLLSGRSGPTQVHPPEQYQPIARMSDAALLAFADSMATLFETETRGATDQRLVDYIDLLSLQCSREIMRRNF